MAVASELVVEEVDERSSAGAVLRAGLASSVRRVATHVPVIRADEDPEGIHQARVGLRRLRSDLRTFRSIVDPEWADALRAEAGWLADALGAVRDLDVLTDRLQRSINGLGDDADATSAVNERLATERAAAHEHAIAALDSPRCGALLDRLLDAATAPRTTDAAEAPALEVVPRLAGRSFRRLRRAVHDLGGDPSAADLHGVRIKAKRARYAAEVAVPVVGRRAKATAKRIRALQDVLGEHQDCVVAEAWLRAGLDDATPRDAFVIGLLVADQRQDAKARRARWPEVWSRVDRPKRTGWMGT